MTQDIRETVRERYGRIATAKNTGCGCGPGDPSKTSRQIGYTKQELASIPDEADLGVGCGNPLECADVSEGDTVLDLGSGAGIDCFLASRRVGASGRVIGVDMTDEMLERARRNAEEGGYTNVEFRKGHIEDLPIEADSVDRIISNCVVNLSPDKPKVFGEALRVLRPGGLLTVSDLVLTEPLPAPIRDSVSAYVGCIAGALLKDEYLVAIRAAGFEQVEVVGEVAYAADALLDLPDVRQIVEEATLSLEEARAAAASVVSIKVRAVKP
jgi:arsenite methyltransferase